MPVQELDAILAFLARIGISVQARPLPEATFLPAIRIERGGLVYDPARLRWPADLLHEAGHIAVTPPERRADLNDALVEGDTAPHGGELEAIAWSWAATMHLGLPPERLFHPEGYKGQSAGLLLSFGLGVCPGAFGLAQAGMTSVGIDTDPSRRYPAMAQWLRPAAPV